MTIYRDHLRRVIAAAQILKDLYSDISSADLDSLTADQAGDYEYIQSDIRAAIARLDCITDCAEVIEK